MNLKFLSIFSLILTAFSFKMLAQNNGYFHDYIENRANQGSNEPIYISEASMEQDNENIDYRLKCIESESLSSMNVLDLINLILSKNSDVVCIQDILSDNDTYTLYQGLNKKYDYFLYIPPKALNSRVDGCDSGLLFVSKYSIKQNQFNIFESENTGTNEGYFDFIIENRGIELGHIYAANIAKNNSEEKVTSKIMQIFEKIKDDVDQNNKAMPFLLFGCLNNSQISKEVKDQLTEYFYPNNYGPNGILAVKYLHITVHLDTVEPEEIESNDNIESEDCSSNDSFVEKKMAQRHLNYQQLLFNQKTDKFIVNKLEVASTRTSKNSFFIMKLSYRGYGELDIKFGGNSDTEVTAGGNFEYRDNNGNVLGGKYEQNNKGGKNLGLYAGRESNSTPKPNQDSGKGKQKK